MDPLDLNIFNQGNNSFYNMGKKTKRKVQSNPTNDMLNVADFAIKSTVALSLTSAALGVAASASQRLNH